MEYVQLTLDHWPFVAAWGAFYAIGKVMKQGPLSARRASEVRFVRLVRRWFPLPLHPILAGVVLGLVPGVPVSPGVEGGLGPALYFGGAGVASIVWHDLYREWKKHRGEPDPGDDGGLGLSAADTTSVPPEGASR